MSSSDSIFNFGLLALAAYVLWSMGLFEKPKEKTATSSGTGSTVTNACPRGKRYSRGLFGDCDPNYVASGWLSMGDECECLTPTPSSTAGTEHSPQTPQPKTDICPYDSGLLAGDRRCNPQSAHEARGEFVFGR